MPLMSRAEFIGRSGRRHARGHLLHHACAAERGANKFGTRRRGRRGLDEVAPGMLRHAFRGPTCQTWKILRIFFRSGVGFRTSERTFRGPEPTPERTGSFGRAVRDAAPGLTAESLVLPSS